MKNGKVYFGVGLAVIILYLLYKSSVSKKSQSELNLEDAVPVPKKPVKDVEKPQNEKIKTLPKDEVTKIVTTPIVDLPPKTSSPTVTIGTINADVSSPPILPPKITPNVTIETINNDVTTPPNEDVDTPIEIENPTDEESPVISQNPVISTTSTEPNPVDTTIASETINSVDTTNSNEIEKSIVPNLVFDIWYDKLPDMCKPTFVFNNETYRAYSKDDPSVIADPSLYGLITKRNNSTGRVVNITRSFYFNRCMARKNQMNRELNQVVNNRNTMIGVRKPTVR
jgi:hypothetical protein|tara:strand:- start:2206 stop:3054 length:849 start_codon:yes stop_codon:yes gene_type:complete